MKTITTKYLSATNTKGSRIKAISEVNSITIPYDYSLSNGDVYWKAAEALCHKLGWTGSMVEGGLDNGYVYVFSNDTKRIIS